MNPWKILEVARTANTKDIKRAYAKKLKVTKPDEKPEEFQALHQAYKAALDYATCREGIAVTSLAEGTEKSISDDVICDAEPLELADSAIIGSAQEKHQGHNDNEKEMAFRRDEYKQLIVKVEVLLKNRPVPSDPAQWSFLANSTYLLEDDFNWSLGKKIFQLFGEYGSVRVHRARGRSYTQKVPIDIVGFCDQVFSWRSRTYYLQVEFGQEFCEDLFSQIENYVENLSINKPNKGLRGGTFIRGSDVVKNKPTENIVSGFFLENIQSILFILFVLVSLARCAQQVIRY